jgi:hypothetical protein
MSTIEKFREKGYELIAEKNLIKFVSDYGIFFFYLDRKEIGTSILYTSEAKQLNKIIKQFEKELGWDDIKEVPFWK